MLRLTLHVTRYIDPTTEKKTLLIVDYNASKVMLAELTKCAWYFLFPELQDEVFVQFFIALWIYVN